MKRVLFLFLTALWLSAGPTFDANLGNSFRIVLAGNVTSCTITDAVWLATSSGVTGM